MLLKSETSGRPSDDERRQAPRIQLVQAIEGCVLPLETPIHVMEVGVGGFSIESPMAFAIGEEHEFRLSLRNGSTLGLRGRVAHCRQQIGGAHQPVYLAGFAFVDELPTERAGAKLVDSVTSSLTFE